jgi:YVTN family beta-propeller protein
MKLRISGLLALAGLALACLLGSAQSLAQNAYITNGENTVSVIDTATNAVTATIPVGRFPFAVAVTADGSRVYVANNNSPGTVSVIDTASNTVIATIPVGSGPIGVAVTADGSRVYVAQGVANTASVSVIDTGAIAESW